MNQDIFLSRNPIKKSELVHTKHSSQSFQHDDLGKCEHHVDNPRNSASYNSDDFSPKQTILPTTTLTNDKSSSFLLSNRRTLASELAANDGNLSASLITTTRPPSSFNHQSLQSYVSQRDEPAVTGTNKISSLSSSAYDNDHNIWRTNSNNYDDNDENDNDSGSNDYSDKYSGTENHHQQGRSARSDNQSNAGADFISNHPRDMPSSHNDDRQRKQQHQFYSGYHSNRPLSPGQYFGARSLPLESMGDLWQQPSTSPSYPLESQKQAFSSRSASLTANNLASKKMNSNDQNHIVSQRSSATTTASYPNRSHTFSDMEPLWQNFKALPAQLHHRHRWTSQSHRHDIVPSSTSGTRSKLSQTSASIHNDDGIECLTEKVQSLRIQDGYINTAESSNTLQQQRRQQHQQQPRQLQSESRQSSYSLHPHDSVTIKCLISYTTIHTHDGHLTLTNNNNSDVPEIDEDDDNNNNNSEHHGKPLLFSLFSANGNVTFDVQSGTVSPGQTIDIWIRPRKRILHRLVTTTNNTVNRTMDEATAPQQFDESVALLVGQDLYRLKVNLDITIEDPEDDDDDDDDNDGDGDDDDQQQQRQQQQQQSLNGQHQQQKSGNSDDDPHLDQAVTTLSQNDDTAKTPATSTLETQGPTHNTLAPPPSTSQTQDHDERCPICLIENLYPAYLE